jgi:protein-export chaperone SecB
MSDENLQPVFQIQRVYLKDLSLEQPNSPAIFLEQEAPGIEVSVDVGNEKLADGIFESTVTVTVTAKIGDKVAFLVEGKQAGILKRAISLKISSIHCWVSVARTSSIHTCVLTSRMRSPALVSHRFICRKSTLKLSMRNVCKSQQIRLTQLKHLRLSSNFS